MTTRDYNKKSLVGNWYESRAWTNGSDGSKYDIIAGDGTGGQKLSSIMKEEYSADDGKSSQTPVKGPRTIMLENEWRRKALREVDIQHEQAKQNLRVTQDEILKSTQKTDFHGSNFSSAGAKKQDYSQVPDNPATIYAFSKTRGNNSGVKYSGMTSGDGHSRNSNFSCPVELFSHSHEHNL